MYKIIGADLKEYGPISSDQLRQWIAEGRANALTKVQLEGSDDWKPLSEVPEFASLFLAAPAPPVPPASSYSYSSPATQVPNYLVPAILSTLCCCMPFGIVSIVYAAQVNSKLAIGDHQGAVIASNNAKMWCWIAFAAGILSWLGFGGINLIFPTISNFAP